MVSDLFIILLMSCFLLSGGCFDRFGFGQRLILNNSSQLPNSELDNKAMIRFALNKIPLDYVEVYYGEGKVCRTPEFDHRLNIYVCNPYKVVWSLQNRLYSISVTKGVTEVIIKGGSAQLKPDLIERRRRNRESR